MMDTLDLSDFDTADTSDMPVAHPLTGEPTTWIITFAGPGHPKTIDLADRRARQQLRDEKAKEQARVNGRKWKAEDKTPAEQRAENVEWIADRVVGWTPVKINGDDLSYSRENAIKLLADPKKGWLFRQCLEFLLAEENFMPSSAKAS
jgi:hypothetical protein